MNILYIASILILTTKVIKMKKDSNYRAVSEKGIPCLAKLLEFYCCTSYATQFLIARTLQLALSRLLRGPSVLSLPLLIDYYNVWLLVTGQC